MNRLKKSWSKKRWSIELPMQRKTLNRQILKRILKWLPNLRIFQCLKIFRIYEEKNLLLKPIQTTKTLPVTSLEHTAGTMVGHMTHNTTPSSECFLFGKRQPALFFAKMKRPVTCD